MDINWKQHIKMQSIFQTNGVDMSISKTINLPSNATKDDIREAIFMSWKLQCKGLTIYRSGSRENEVLNLKAKDIEPEILLVENENGNIIIETRKDNIFKRPRHLFGATYKVQSGCGKLYVTINERNGKPYEVFIQSGGSGGCEAGNQALGRTISLALRNGGDIHNIIKQLCKVKCPAALRNIRSEGKSCSDIVGKLITESIPDDDEDEDTPSLQHEKLEQCPSCKEYTLVRESGCKICHSCGYNKCG
jgi:ribonucleoside-diphosphate reductase alpha chain